MQEGLDLGADPVGCGQQDGILQFGNLDGGGEPADRGEQFGVLFLKGGVSLPRKVGDAADDFISGGDADS